MKNLPQPIPAKLPKSPTTIPRRGATKTTISLITETLVVYAGKGLAEAVNEVTHKMSIYDAVRLSQISEAVYKQGRKDGAREVFEQLDGLKRLIPHRNPGQPRKRKR